MATLNMNICKKQKTVKLFLHKCKKAIKKLKESFCWSKAQNGCQKLWATNNL